MTKQNGSQRIRSYLGLSDHVNGFGGGGGPELEPAMRDAVAMFRSLQVEYALFGAFAVAAYVSERRSTQDIDFVAPQEAAGRIREEAPKHGFTDLRPGLDSPVLSFRHRGGAEMDVICDAIGFADLQQVKMVSISGIGDVPVAAAVDVAYSKLRTQLTEWERSPRKRPMDRSDLIAMLQENPGLAAEIRSRLDLAGRPNPRGDIRSSQMRGVFEAVCRESGIDAPRSGGRIRASRGLGSVLLCLNFLALVFSAAMLLWVIREKSYEGENWGLMGAFFLGGAGLVVQFMLLILSALLVGRSTAFTARFRWTVMGLIVGGVLLDGAAMAIIYLGSR